MGKKIYYYKGVEMSQPKGNKRPIPYKKHRYIPKVNDIFKVFVDAKERNEDLFGNDCNGRELVCSPQVAIEPPASTKSKSKREFVWTNQCVLQNSRFKYVKVA